MKLRFLMGALIAALLVVELFASGQAGLYGVVERVVFEPSQEAPQRVQVWGAFALIEHVTDRFTNYVYEEPARGYVYFELPPDPEDAANARREWADLASVAGTGEAVAFGYWDRNRGDLRMTVRDAGLRVEDPDPYYTDIGVTKLPADGGHAAIVATLRGLLGPKAP